MRILTGSTSLVFFLPRMWTNSLHPSPASMSYPDYLIRGIPHPSLVEVDGLPSAGLFPFDKPESARLPGYREESINWYDDEGAIRHTFDQRKDDGTVKFRGGIAVLPRSELDRLKNNPNLRGRFDYERYPLDTNQYHGNMLLNMDVPKQLIRKMAGLLALYAQVIKPEDYEGQ
jgi:hypothetical protein